ncbi:hypothetical protein, partial [Escherichia sp. MOD1-EC5949]|uniref:hypothetical protein n=1 Tax=Escherichia sp. MOD1-EC5949 TaxID=2093878 RepID=UPI001F40713B
RLVRERFRRQTSPQGASGHDLRKTLARKCSNPTRGEIPLPRPLAHYVRSLGLRRAVAALS